MKGNVHWPLLIFYCAFEGWVIAFPLFGPVLGPLATSYGANPVMLATTFLFFFAISFAVWGFVLRKQSHSLHRLRIPVIATILFSLLLSFSLLALPAHLWAVVFALFGVLSSFPSLVWLSFVSQGLDRKKIGWNLGITGVFVEFVAYIVGMLGQSSPNHPLFILIQVLPVISILTLFFVPSLFVSTQPINRKPQKRASSRWSLYLFIFSFPLVGGIMYNVVQPLFLAGYPRILNDYGNLPYVLTMPLAGYIADKKTIRPVALYGLASLGLSYTVFVLSKSWWSAFTGNTFLHIGFAFMDLFVLFILAWYAPRQNSTLYIGGGLGVYIFSILAGTWLTELIVPHTKGNYNVVYLIAILIMFVSFFLLEWIVKRTDAADLPYEAIGEDLELARGVQQNMLPRSTDVPAGWDVAYTLEVAREVGGDFFDVIALSNDRALFVIGDVMGKGLAAAMLVSSVLGQIRSLAETTQSLPDLLGRVNRVLIRDARFSMYVTVGLTLVDKVKGTLTYTSAGHMPPYILRNASGSVAGTVGRTGPKTGTGTTGGIGTGVGSGTTGGMESGSEAIGAIEMRSEAAGAAEVGVGVDMGPTAEMEIGSGTAVAIGTVHSLDVSFLPLGTDIEAEYGAETTEFRSGDVLLLYTDGIVEAKNKRKELYGFERLEAAFSLCTGMSAEEINQHLAEEVRGYIGPQAIEDDFTLLVVKVPDPAN